MAKQKRGGKIKRFEKAPKPSTRNNRLKTGSTVYEQLFEYFEGDDRLDELCILLNNIADLLLYPTSDEMLAQMERSKAGSYNKTVKPTPASLRRYFDWIRKLHYIYNIPLEVFDARKDQILPDPEFLDKFQETRMNFVLDMSCIDKSDEEIEINVGRYKRAITGVLDSSSDVRCWVYDYLEEPSHKNYEKASPYHDVHGIIYAYHLNKFKETRDTNPNDPSKWYDYMRVLTPPISYPEGKRDGEKEMLADILDYCSVQLFQHICDIIFASKKWLLEANSESGIYLNLRTPHTSHFGLLTGHHTEYTFTQNLKRSKLKHASSYLRGSKSDVYCIEPSIMFLQRSDLHLNKLSEIYDTQIRNMVGDHCIHLTDLEQIYKATDLMYKRTMKNITEEYLTKLRTKYDRESQKFHRASAIEKMRIIDELMENINSNSTVDDKKPGPPKS